jgi:hypothetical protein
MVHIFRKCYFCADLDVLKISSFYTNYFLCIWQVEVRVQKITVELHISFFVCARDGWLPLITEVRYFFSMQDVRYLMFKPTVAG